MQSIFEEDIKQRKVVLEKYNKYASFIGIFKLVLLIIICYGAYNAYENKYPINMLILVGVEIIVYIIAHIFHRRAFARINLEEGLVKIDEGNIKRITNRNNEYL